MSTPIDHITHLAGERPAYPLSKPTVVRHIVVRLLTDENPGTAPTQVSSAIDAAAAHEREAAREWAEFCTKLGAFINHAIRQFGGSDQVSLVRGPAAQNQRSINSTVMVQLTPDAPVPTSTRPACRVRLRLDVHSEFYAITVAADRFDLKDAHWITRALGALIDGPAVDAPPRDEQQLLDRLHHTIWDDAGGAFGMVFVGAPFADLPGAVFADLRGIVVPDTPPGAAPVDGAAAPTAELCGSLAAFWDRRRSGMIEALFGASMDVGCEAVVCAFLEGRALYMAPLVRWADSPKPVKYLLVCSDISDDQLGRLVRRMHVLFELRHVALLDYDRGPGAQDLRAASRKLRSIGVHLDDAIKKRKVIDVDGLLDINEQVTGLNDYADGGLVYRVEQSRLYVREFASRIDDLRISRIEGYQPYDAFARRRLFHLFARIEQIGRRYSALGRRVNRWAFLSEASSASAFHKDMIKLQLTADGFLENAEKFASVFAVYYAGHVGREFFVGEGAAAMGWTMLQQQPGPYDAAWFFVLAVVVLDAAGNDGKLARAVWRGVGAVGRVVPSVGRGLIDLVDPARHPRVRRRLDRVAHALLGRPFATGNKADRTHPVSAPPPPHD